MMRTMRTFAADAQLDAMLSVRAAAGADYEALLTPARPSQRDNARAPAPKRGQP